MYPFVEFPINNIDSFDSFVEYLEDNGIKVSPFSKEVRTSLPQNKIEAIQIDAEMKFSGEVADFTFQHFHTPRNQFILQLSAESYSEISETNREIIKNLFPDKFNDLSLEKSRNKQVKRSKLENVLFKVLIFLPISVVLLLLFFLGYFAVVGIRFTFGG